MKRKQIGFSLLSILSLTMLLFGAPGAGFAQGGSRTFPQTGQTVSGNFLTYWDGHGGLAQQGYPISGEIQEKSDLNGQTYGVQYFERAVFEHHPENRPPFDVLLSQLGTFRYKAKYGNGGAPDQHIDSNNPRVFSETGHAIGGKFRTYWEGHGGLAQQGFPISDEFTEVSDLNHQPYTVQYFERAVFELHPENQPPFDVLLSQLGTFQYKAKYGNGGGGGGGGGGTGACSDLPAANAGVVITPNCARPGSSFTLQASGFTPGEVVIIRFYDPPDGHEDGYNFETHAGSNGVICCPVRYFVPDTTQGIYKVLFDGQYHKLTGYLKVSADAGTGGGGGPAPTQPPPPSNGCDAPAADAGVNITPVCARPGSSFTLSASGFTAGETVIIRFYDPPDGHEDGYNFSKLADSNGVICCPVRYFVPDTTLGVYKVLFDGQYHKRTGYIKITP